MAISRKKNIGLLLIEAGILEPEQLEQALLKQSKETETGYIGDVLIDSGLIDEKTKYRDYFDNSEMVFYKNENDLSEKILKISRDEKLRKSIGRKGKNKYMRFFNSTKVAEFIINKTLDIESQKKFFWHN